MSAALVSNVVPLTKAVSFDDLWAAVPPEKRIDKALCRAKFTAIISEQGMHTKNLDRDSGLFIAVHLKATAEELLRGWIRYIGEHATADTRWHPPAKMKLKEGGKYVRHLSTWLNRGGWDE
jgi:hypothetical protein